jgi:hypothetical protein
MTQSEFLFLQPQISAGSTLLRVKIASISFMSASGIDQPNANIVVDFGHIAATTRAMLTRI